MRLAIHQFAPVLGDMPGNAQRMAAAATESGAELVLTPELSLSGYDLRDDAALLALPVHPGEPAAFAPALADLPGVVVGLPELGDDGVVYNAAVLVRSGHVTFRHRKRYLPTYGMFDEGRYFVPGPRLAPIACALGRFGILICEDAWHLSSAVILAHAGVDALLVLAGGPTELDGGGEPAGSRRWHWIMGATAVTTVSPVFFANRCGWEEGVLFGGRSWAVDGRGTSLAAPAPALDEALVVAPLSLAAVARTRTLIPIPVAERFDLWRAALGGQDA